MLRVLDLQNAEFRVTQHDINKIGLLYHLKYLYIPAYGSYIYALPKSIGNLKDLRTLDIRGTYITELPNEVTKLQSLCSLRCSHKGYTMDQKDCLVKTMRLPLVKTMDLDIRAKIIAELHMASSACWTKHTNGVKLPKGIGRLKELQVLECVDIKRSGNKIIQELGELTQLRKLGVTGFIKKNGKIFCEALEKLTSRCSLSVDGLDWLDSISSPPPYLRKIYLRSKLKDGEASKVLQKLPNLMDLRLSGEGYAGREDLLTSLNDIVMLHGKLGMRRIRSKHPELRDKLDMLQREMDNYPEMGKLWIPRKHPELRDTLDMLQWEMRRSERKDSHLPMELRMEVAKSEMLREMEVVQRALQVKQREMRRRRSKHDLGNMEGSEVREQATSSIPELGESSQSRSGPDTLDNPPTTTTITIK